MYMYIQDVQGITAPHKADYYLICPCYICALQYIYKSSLSLAYYTFYHIHANTKDDSLCHLTIMLLPNLVQHSTLQLLEGIVR